MVFLVSSETDNKYMDTHLDNNNDLTPLLEVIYD